MEAAMQLFRGTLRALGIGKWMLTPLSNHEAVGIGEEKASSCVLGGTGG